MRPLDPRLTKHAQAVRTYLFLAALIGTALAAITIAQAFVLGDLLAGVFNGTKSASQITRSLFLIGGLAVGRSLMTWFSDSSAHSASSKTKNFLRQATTIKISQLGPIWVSSQRGSTISTTLMRGLDSLDVYFARYLPQLILAVTIPFSVGIAISTQDKLSALLVLVTVPLIPFFMVLIGWFTQSQVDQQWSALQRLAGHFLDLINGLATLKAFNRSQGQSNGLAKIGEDYRSSTMSVLRISFLSSLVLELISTISVALVAVSIGLRLVDGKMNLREGLIILILVPEVYLPLRSLGAQFHAMTEGLEAADLVLTILDEPLPVASGHAQIQLPKEIVFKQVCVTYPGYATGGLQEFSAKFQRGKLNVLTGPSGVGKTSALNALLGFISPSNGELLIDGVSLSELDIESWRKAIAYLPQNPWLPISSIRDALRMVGDFKDEQLLEVCTQVGLAISDPEQFPFGLDTTINVNTGASTGQRRRLAFARTLLLNRDLVVLDEPTAAVDRETEELLTTLIQELVEAGKFVIVVAHRPNLIAAGTNVIQLAESVST